MATTRATTNKIQLGDASKNVFKVQTKMKTGPIIQRAALGEIRNKQNIQRSNTIQVKSLAQKKSELPLKQKLLPRALKKGTKDDDKENAGVKKVAIPERVEESMEIDENEKTQVEELSLAFSSQLLNIEDIDAEDSQNPELVSAYVNDIYKYIWELEDKHSIMPKFLEGQKVTHKMRAILIDWLVQVQVRFTLLQETLYLTVAIIDRYLMAVKTTPREKLQLVGVTAMFIASKYEEMYIPEVADFAYITDKTFSKEDILRMEVHMLKSLDFYISYPLPLHFLRRNSKAGHVDAAHHTLAKYLMELTLTEYEFSHYKPSLIAAAALYLSMKLINVGLKWNDTLCYYSKYSEKDVLPAVYKLSNLVINTSKSKQQAVRNKYKASKFMKISDMKELQSPFNPILKRYAAKNH